MRSNIELTNDEIENCPDQSWLHGKYPAIEAEINTQLPYVSIGDYFWQGDEADTVISEIHLIWIRDGNISVPDAISRYSNLYL